MRLFVGMFFLLLFSSVSAEEMKAKLEDNIVETTHKIRVHGGELAYKATTGSMVLRDEDDKAKATVFFVAYQKEGTEDYHDRPITFCFNGGPGSSSVWLHLGSFGPRVVDIDGLSFDAPPYDLRDNPDTLLAATDLVFIDPVSTGYSRAAPEEDPKQFHGVEEDVDSVAAFIRLWTTRYGRWESPKFLAGESYGSTRAAKLADKLHEDYGFYVNGVVLISTVLNFQTLRDDTQGNDLPYILYLPPYAATAWYHKKLSPDLQKKSFQVLLAEAEQFAMTDYAAALFKGDALTKQEREAIINRMAAFTGLSKNYIDRANLRVGQSQFSAELLRDEKQVTGRFDSRFKGDSIDLSSSTQGYDPSLEAVIGAFTAAFYQYVTNELEWHSDAEYKVLANVSPWNFNGAKNTYLNVSPDLREVMIKNPKLKVLAANGYFDLATTYFANIYTYNHLNLPSNIKPNLSLTLFPAGHMMYTDNDSLVTLNRSIMQVIDRATSKQ